MTTREPIRQITSRYVALPRDNVDTDQIIPARFLTTTRRDGLGGHAFHDWRYRADGSPDPDFPLNRPEAGDARILVGGHNFGCGSSREHAVWALAGAGFQAVVSSGFADIFRANALANGLLPVEVPERTLRQLLEAARPVSSRPITVDLQRSILLLPDGSSVPFPVPEFARHCLVEGLDELDFLIAAGAEIDAWEAQHPSTASTRL